jgi:hypothetical protein
MVGMNGNDVIGELGIRCNAMLSSERKELQQSLCITGEGKTAVNRLDFI